VIRIRFHGRRGHGVKTASRIVGTAAFAAGCQTQDSPIYGAERRGAPVTAFTRINGRPIRERGVIQSPDLIVVADETLLADPGAGVLAGQESASAVLVNAEPDGGLAERFKIGPRVVAIDITGATLEAFGRASALSAGLAAIAAKATGLINEDQLVGATREELEHVQLPAEAITKNVELARGLFRRAPAVEIDRKEIATTASLVHIAHDEPARAAPSIFAAGNADQRHTGA
jgi:pyruvate ferredoxin oxidoreductase gamma subunit